MDLLGQALKDYYHGKQLGALEAASDLGDTEEVPIAHFFRDPSDMPALESLALEYAYGEVLDIGCGAGSHCLALQERGLRCTGLDRSAGAVEVAKQRGVRSLIQADIWTFEVGKFDTLLLLMNGIGLAGRLENLGHFLRHLKGLLKERGQILMDSSDLRYLYQEDEAGGLWVPGDRAYYGELRYRWQYDGKRGEPFPWLFVDFQTLRGEAERQGLVCEQLFEGPHYDYLAKIYAPYKS